MKIKCPSCSASYDMDENRVPVAGMTIKCPRCQAPFKVTRAGAAPTGSNAPVAPAAPAPAAAPPVRAPNPFENAVAAAMRGAGMSSVPAPAEDLELDTSDRAQAPPPREAATTRDLGLDIAADAAEATPLELDESPNPFNNNEPPPIDLNLPPASEMAPAGASADMLDFADDAGPASVKRWHVRRKSGKVFGPFDGPAIVTMLKHGQLFGNEDISLDEKSWVPLTSEPDFAREVKPDAAPKSDAPAGPRSRPPAGPKSRPPADNGSMSIAPKGGMPPGMAPAGARPGVAPPRIAPPVMGPGKPGEAPATKEGAAPAVEVTGAHPGKIGPKMPVWVRLLLRRLPLLAGFAAVLVILIGGIALGKFTSYGYFGTKLFSGKGHAAGGSAGAAEKPLETFDKDVGIGTFASCQKALADANAAVGADPESPEAVLDLALASARLSHRYGTAKGDLEKAKGLLAKIPPKSPEASIAQAALDFGGKPSNTDHARALLQPLLKDVRGELLYGDVLIAAKNYVDAAKHLDAILAARPSAEAAMQRAEAAHEQKIADKDKAEKDKAEKDKAEKDKAEKDKAEKEKADHDKPADKDKVADHDKPADKDKVADHDKPADKNEPSDKIADKGPDLEQKFLDLALTLVPNHARARLWSARLALANGKPDDAAAILKKLLVDPDVKDLDATEEGLGHKLQGDILVAGGKLEDALPEYDQALKADPTIDGVAATEADILVKLRRWPDAAAAYEKLLEKSGDDVPTLLGSARALIQTEALVKAGERIEKARKKDEKQPLPWVAAGDLAVALHHEPEAHKDYQAAIKADPKCVPALAAEASLDIAEHNLSDAKFVLDKAVAGSPKEPGVLSAQGRFLLASKQPKDAEQSFRAALETSPDSAEANAGLGEALAAQKKDSDAADAYKKAVAVDSRNIAYREGYSEVLKRQGDLPGALEQLKAAVAVNEKDGHLQAILGGLYIAMDKADGAEKALKLALQLAEDDPLAQAYQGILMSQMKGDSKGVDMLKKAAETAPDDAEIRYQLGLALERAQQLGPASEAFAATIKLDDSMLDAREHLGVILTQESNFNDAIDALKAVLEKDPKRAKAISELSDAEFKAENYGAAIRDLKAAFDIDPKIAGLHYRLGLAYDKQNDSANAEKSYLQATKDDPNDAMPYYYLGYIYKAKGKAKDAIAAFEKYLKLGKDLKDADDINDEIGFLKGDKQ